MKLKKINKVLIIFFIVNTFLVFGVWRYIHSKQFSTIISNKISELLTKRFGTQLIFTGVDFNFFNASTSLKNVYIRKVNDSLNLDLKLNELKVSFTFSSFVTNNLEINELGIKDGRFLINYKENENSDFDFKKLRIKNTFKAYQDLLKNLPVKIKLIKIENIKLKVNNNEFFLKEIALTPVKKEARLKVDISNLNINEIPNTHLKFESMFLLTRFNQDEFKIEDLILKNEKDSIRSNVDFTDFETQKKGIKIKGNLDLNLSIDKYLPYFSQIKNIPKEFLDIKGNIKASIIAENSLLNPDIKADLRLSHLKSEWIVLDILKIKFKKKNQILTLEKLNAQNLSESYNLLKPFNFFELGKNKLLSFKTLLEIKDANSQTFLYSLKDVLKDLYFKASGKVEVVYDFNKIFFNTFQKLKIQSLRLESAESKKNILNMHAFDLENTSFTLDNKLELGIVSEISMPMSKIFGKGKIGKDGVNLLIKNSKINMKEIGPIAGIDISGEGPLNLVISGPYNKILFDFDTTLSNFSLIDLNFGKVNSHFNLDLHNLQLNILKLDGAFNSSKYKADGFLNFSNNSNMDINLNFSETNFFDSKKMYGLVFKKLKLPIDIDFNFKTAFKISGGYDLNSIKPVFIEKF